MNYNSLRPLFHDGNLYKPEDGGATFADGRFNQENFEKKTNEDDEDWSDILALFEALHDDTFNTYGRMSHNYYLYNNPETGLLTWIPWDNNEALQNGKMGGALALDFSDLNSDSWPLIGKIYADEVYKARYDDLRPVFSSDRTLCDNRTIRVFVS